MDVKILTEETIPLLDKLEYFMDLQLNITDNLSISYIELNNWDTDDEDDYKDCMFELSFYFYNKWYIVWINQKYLDKDYLTVQAEGNSELFYSFINAIESTHDELILSLCKQYLKVLNND